MSTAGEGVAVGLGDGLGEGLREGLGDGLGLGEGLGLGDGLGLGLGLGEAKVTEEACRPNAGQAGGPAHPGEVAVIENSVLCAALNMVEGKPVG